MKDRMRPWVDPQEEAHALLWLLFCSWCVMVFVLPWPATFALTPAIVIAAIRWGKS